MKLKVLFRRTINLGIYLDIYMISICNTNLFVYFCALINQNIRRDVYTNGSSVCFGVHSNSP